MIRTGKAGYKTKRLSPLSLLEDIQGLYETRCPPKSLEGQRAGPSGCFGDGVNFGSRFSLHLSNRRLSMCILSFEALSFTRGQAEPSQRPAQRSQVRVKTCWTPWPAFHWRQEFPRGQCDALLLSRMSPRAWWATSLLCSCCECTACWETTAWPWTGKGREGPRGGGWEMEKGDSGDAGFRFALEQPQTRTPRPD